MSTRTLITIEELLHMPDVEPCELIEGELVRRVPTQQPHGYVAAEFHLLIGGFAKQHRLGITGIAEVGYILSRNPDTVRVPDVSFVSRQRIPPGGPTEGYWPFAPDLAVEVLSPSDEEKAVSRKVRQYLDAGTRLVWVADYGTRTVVVHAPGREPRTLGPDDMLDGEDVLPGFSVRVGDILAPDL